MLTVEQLIEQGNRQIGLAFVAPRPSLGKPEHAWQRLVDNGHVTLAELAQRAGEHREAP